MKQNGLQVRWKLRFVESEDSRHDLPVAAKPTGWTIQTSARIRPAVDITSVRTDSGWLYGRRAGSSRKVVALAMARNRCVKHPADDNCPTGRAGQDLLAQ